MFKQETGFNGSTFHARVDFSNAEFLSQTSFGSIREDGEPPKPLRLKSEPPRFFGAKLHEDTDWTDIQWPPIPTEKYAALEHRRIYERLKLLMEEKSKFHDEFFFFQKEMQCWAAAQSRGLTRFSIRAFGWLSEYGWSIRRPLLGLYLTWVVGALVLFGLEFADHAFWGGTEHLKPWQAIGLSTSNIFAFLGMGFHITRDELLSLTGYSEVVAGAQMFLGPLFLFLLVLALRNRFRIK